LPRTPLAEALVVPRRIGLRHHRGGWRRGKNRRPGRNNRSGRRYAGGWRGRSVRCRVMRCGGGLCIPRRRLRRPWGCRERSRRLLRRRREGFSGRRFRLRSGRGRRIAEQGAGTGFWLSGRRPAQIPQQNRGNRDAHQHQGYDYDPASSPAWGLPLTRRSRGVHPARLHSRQQRNQPAELEASPPPGAVRTRGWCRLLPVRVL